MRAARTLATVVTSALLVVPCLWLPIVSASDLQSHLYDAWLANLVADGQAPGVWIAPQRTNVLVDVVLSWLVARAGVAPAERALTIFAVLLFFWGSFRVVQAAHREPPLWLLPWLALTSYGFPFQMGLLNFLVSSGFVLWALAVAWDRTRPGLAVAAVLTALAALAHPLPPLWLVGLLCYRELAIRVSARGRWLLLGAGVALLFVLHACVAARANVVLWSPFQLHAITGATQARLYGWRYLPVALALFALVLALALDARAGGRWRGADPILASWYALTAAAILILPSGYRVEPGGAWAGSIHHRLGVFAFVLLVALLAAPTRRRTYFAAGLAAAAYFFALLYADVDKASRMEARIASLVSALPPEQRVVQCVPDLAFEEPPAALVHRLADGLERWFLEVARLPDGPGALVRPTHLVSRACIGRCYDFANHEPSSGQFRIRASPGNPFVTTRSADVYAMEAGEYVAAPGDDLHVIYRCGAGPASLCVDRLPVGKTCRELAARRGLTDRQLDAR